MSDTGWPSWIARQVAGITYRQLDYWARTGLVTPSIEAATGQGSSRRYSVKDVVILKAGKQLIDLGLSLQAIRPVVAWLQTADDLNTTLVCDGIAVYPYNPDRPGSAFTIDIRQVARDVTTDLQSITEAAA